LLGTLLEGVKVFWTGIAGRAPGGSAEGAYERSKVLWGCGRFGKGLSLGQGCPPLPPAHQLAANQSPAFSAFPPCQHSSYLSKGLKATESARFPCPCNLPTHPHVVAPPRLFA